MKRNGKTPDIVRGLFPAITAFIALLLFIVVYVYLTMWSINQRYIGNLIFAVPFVCFGGIAVFTVAGKIEPGISAMLTGVLLVVSGVAMVLLLGCRVLQESTTVTTDVGKYERVLKLAGYPGNPLIRSFPMEIPEDAENVLFRYNPAFGQGGENFELKFDAPPESVEDYAAFFSRASRWEGKLGSSEAGKFGILPSAFYVFGYRDLPEDFTIYLFYSQPYRPGDWNHGELTLAAISNDRNEILFHAEKW